MPPDWLMTIIMWSSPVILVVAVVFASLLAGGVIDNPLYDHIHDWLEKRRESKKKNCLPSSSAASTTADLNQLQDKGSRNHNQAG